MATILIVSGSYYPYATANAVCAKKLEDVLKENGHEVLYCIRKHDLYEEDYHVYDGTELYTVGKNSDLFFQTVEKLQKLDLPNGMGDAFRVSCNVYRALMKAKGMCTSKDTIRENARSHYIQRYADKIYSIIMDRKVDLVLSVSMPFDSHIAVLKALQMCSAENKPKWIAYCIDAYWSKVGIPKNDIPKMKAEERNVFDACDSILFLDTIVNDYSDSSYDVYRNKMVSLPLPLFDLEDLPAYHDGIQKQDGTQDWVFTGTIYDGSRNIEEFSSILRELKGYPLRMHFIGKIYPRSLACIEKLQSEMPEQIIVYGRRSYEFAKGSMQRADILVNLANDNTNQIPSKIFEYMGCLKPILTIYKMEEDVGTSYLKKYPLAYNQRMTGTVFIERDRLMQWVGEVVHNKVSLDQLRDLYQDVLSGTVTDRFYTFAMSLLERK